MLVFKSNVMWWLDVMSTIKTLEKVLRAHLISTSTRPKSVMYSSPSPIVHVTAIAILLTCFCCCRTSNFLSNHHRHTGVWFVWECTNGRNIDWKLKVSWYTCLKQPPMGPNILVCLWRWPLNRGLNLYKIYIWVLDKWLLKTGGLLIQVAFITDSAVVSIKPALDSTTIWTGIWEQLNCVNWAYNYKSDVCRCFRFSLCL